MSKTTYQVGDTVQLKSGGPKMTVQDPSTSLGIKCQWFAGSKLEHGFFPESSLMRPEPDEKKEGRKR